MENLLQPITFNKDILGGKPKPLIRGLRISVELMNRRAG